MTNPDREELVKIADDLSFIPSKEDGLVDLGCVTDVERDLIVTALRRLASSDGGVKGEPEPVAWRYRYNGEWYLSDTKAFAKAGLDVTPLYTAPPADAGMREACLRILPYLRWTISDESPGHHPTMPSAVTEFEAALTAPGATTKSDVEALAATTAERPGTVTSEPEPSTSDPSSTRSEVTVEELADWLFANLRTDTEPHQDARALLDQFQIRRK